jgi:hypothetical protein
MKIEIDQSGKIEDTAKPTSIAFANGITYAIRISSRDKKYIQAHFRTKGHIRLFIYKTFTALVFILIRHHIHKLTYIVIDIEYQGKEHLIIEMLVRLLRKFKLNEPKIHFKRIGNRPKVHYVAYDVFSGKKKADEQITYEMVLKIISYL